MKEFLYKTIGFVTVAIIITGILARFDNIDADYNSNSNIVSLQNKSEFDDLDILFLGNSYSYSGIQPAILDSLNIKSLNAGIASSGPMFYQLILNDYLKSVSEKPKAVFILVSPMTFSDMADNFVLYPIHRYLENPVSNIKIIFKYGLYDSILPLYKKSVRKIFSNIFGSENDIQNERNVFLKNRGFIAYESTFTMAEVAETEDSYIPLRNSPYSDERMEIIEEISMNLEKGGIKVVFFELPVNVLKNYFSQNYLEEYESMLQEIEQNHTLFRIDSNLFSHSDYRNIDHMNESGSRIATLELIKKISNNEELSGLFNIDHNLAEKLTR